MKKRSFLWAMNKTHNSADTCTDTNRIRWTKTCLLLLVGVISLPNLGLAQTKSEHLFFQAETMTTAGDGWAVGSHFPNWYGGVPLEDMLNGAKKGQGQAVQELNIPARGMWRLWVRYLDYNAYRGPFRLTVLQDEKECGHRIFDQASLRADDAGRKRWGGGFGAFVWDFLDVPLEAGAAKMVLTKEEPFGVSWLARKIDCFALTTDLAYVPKESDFVAPLWVRVTLEQDHPQASSISIWGRRPYAPVFLTHNQLGREGLEPRHYARSAAFLDVGEASPWVNIAPLLTTRGRNNMRFMAMVRYPQPLEGADFELLFASEPSDDAVIKRFHRSGPGGGILVTVDLSRRDDIRSELSWSRDALAAARASAKPIGRRARRFPLMTGLSVSPAVNIQETMDNELEILTALGISGLGPERALVEKGFVRPRSASFYFHQREEGCLNRPKREAIREQLTTAAEKLIADGMAENLVCFSLMDEPSSASLEHLTECEVCKEAFQVFLRDRQKLPLAHFGRQSWEQIAPTAAKQDARLYYWTARFRHQVLADFFKLGTDILRELIPDIRTTSNYAEELSYRGNLLARGVDWFLIQNQEALTYGWNEDWCNLSVSSQLSGYHADFLRAACRAQGQTFGMYTILGGRTPWDIQAKTVGKIGHGAKAIHYFNYGPTYTLSSDMNSHRHEIYPALAKVNHAIGAVEDYILDGHVSTGRVALLYSHSSDIWTQEESPSLHGKERQNIWLLLRHLGYTPEIVTEAQVQADGLDAYDLVFIHGAYLESDAATAVIDWVKAGGTLYLGAGSALFDHYNQPLDFDKRLGIGRGEFTVSQMPGPQDVNHLSARKVLATATVSDQTLEAICGLHELTVWTGAQVLLAFADQKPALVSGAIGKGRVIAAGFFPGLTYTRGGVAERSKRNVAVTGNPPSYPVGCRTVFSEMLGKTTPRDPATTSHYLVEAGLLESPHGLLVTLANWSGTPVTNLEVRVRTAANLKEPAAVLAPIKSIRREGTELVLTLDVEAFEFIVMSRK